MAENGQEEKEKGKEKEKGTGKRKGEGEGKGEGERGGKVEVPQLLAFDDVTGRYKEGSTVTKEELPLQCQEAFNNAWNVSACDCAYLTLAYLPSIRDYPAIEAIIPDPGLHADFPGIQANLPGSRILRKSTTFHTGMASCVRIFFRTALQCSQVRARQRA